MTKLFIPQVGTQIRLQQESVVKMNNDYRGSGNTEMLIAKGHILSDPADGYFPRLSDAETGLHMHYSNNNTEMTKAITIPKWTVFVITKISIKGPRPTDDDHITIKALRCDDTDFLRKRILLSISEINKLEFEVGEGDYCD